MCRRSPCVGAGYVIPPPKRTIPAPVTVNGNMYVRGGAQAEKTGPRGSGLDTANRCAGPVRAAEGVWAPAPWVRPALGPGGEPGARSALGFDARSLQSTARLCLQTGGSCTWGRRLSAWRSLHLLTRSTWTEALLSFKVDAEPKSKETRKATWGEWARLRAQLFHFHCSVSPGAV